MGRLFGARLAPRLEEEGRKSLRARAARRCASESESVSLGVRGGEERGLYEVCICGAFSRAWGGAGVPWVGKHILHEGSISSSRLGSSVKSLRWG